MCRKTTVFSFFQMLLCRRYSLASGAPIDPEVEVDVLRAEAAGRAAKEQFIQERFVSNKSEFFDSLKKLNLKTMDQCSKRVKLTSAQGKLFVYQEQSNLAYQLLVKLQIMDKPINIEELIRYPLSPVPHALGSPDGYFAKTNKSAILHHLDRDEEVPYPQDALYNYTGWQCPLSHDDQLTTNLWGDLHVAPGPNGCQASVCLLHRLLPARFHQSPRATQAWLY
ncbi:uncharacterized protein LOC132872444 isoform X1 [Neoarius graeffei]|uniref:uncharacterized protein LOC132872444 isoform X1 n=1 Tax=Neoarius graeffei TaxID=443677 RepID=UPI00298CAD33|nr:uncharacterized protein LOC132872444 isoform X1 [Neoarius graeffei]